MARVILLLLALVVLVVAGLLWFNVITLNGGVQVKVNEVGTETRNYVVQVPVPVVRDGTAPADQPAPAPAPAPATGPAATPAPVQAPAPATANAQ